MKDDLDFIKCETRWPLWPSLPLKRRRKDGGWPELGTLFSPAQVIKTNPKVTTPYCIVIDNFDGSEPKTEFYATAQCVLDAGWIVD